MPVGDSVVSNADQARLSAAYSDVTPGAVLALLSVDPSRSVRHAALANWRLPVAAMNAFLNQPMFSTVFASRDDFDIDYQPSIEFISDIVSFVYNPAITEQMITRVVMSVFLNSGNPAAFELMDDLRNDVMEIVVTLRVCPKEVLDWAVSSLSVEMRKAACLNPTLTKQQVLSLLFGLRPPLRDSARQQGSMMSALVDNPGVPRSLLLRLVPDLGIPALQLLGNMSHGADRQACVLELLGRTHHTRDRAWAAERVASTSWVRILAKDEAEEVLIAVARNEFAPADVISTLCHDASPEVRSWAACHPLARELDQVFVSLMPQPVADE